MRNPIEWYRFYDCFICTSHKPDKDGYPAITVFKPKRLRTTLARVICQRRNPTMGSLQVRNLCGNRLCIRPDHLIPATPMENVSDRKRHGTERFGERHHNVRLTESQVKDIRSSNRSDAYLSRKYGVSHSAIQHIKHNRSWRHIE